MLRTQMASRRKELCNINKNIRQGYISSDAKNRKNRNIWRYFVKVYQKPTSRKYLTLLWSWLWPHDLENNYIIRA